MTCSVLPASFSAVSAQWQQMLQEGNPGSIFLTPQWQRAWWDEFGAQDSELCLLLLGPEERPHGLAPLMRHGDTLSFLGDSDLFDYHDFVVADSAPSDLYAGLARCLLSERWRTLDLRSIPEGSSTLQHLPDLLERQGCEVTVDEEGVSPGVPLPAAWDEYVAALGKKDRHELRRKLRRLEEGEPYRLLQSGSASLEPDLTAFLGLMRESQEKRDFLTPERESFFRRMAGEMRDQGYLRLFFLELQGERVAGVLCFDYGGRRLLYNSGYLPAYGALSVGLMVKALCLRQAIDEGLTYFDLLRGAEPYKYHLGGRDIRLCRLVAHR